MSVSVSPAPRASEVRRNWQDREQWTTIADFFAIMAALSLPWSTSLVAIFVPCWLGAVLWVMDWRAFVRLLKRPICYIPLAFVGLVILGTLWSDATWDLRLRAINPALKLAVLPVLFYHFERSSRGMWVLITFLGSCALLMLVSFIVAFEPNLSLKPNSEAGRGIFVKNYIDQSQEFALCAVALIYPIVMLLRAKQTRQALALGALALGFIANMAFVIVSRTAIITMPIMLLVFALLHLRRRISLIIVGLMIAITAMLWFTTTELRWGPRRLVKDYQIYKTENAVTSVGLRLEFWRKALRFSSEAPVIGHGTGSLHGLFERAKTGYSDQPPGDVISNPHNQTLNVAVQWGIIGVTLLYAMWLVHLLLFRGDGLFAWIGLLVVVQNVFSSVFNSHIFDFHEGWMYVLGVGVAGGMTLAGKRHNVPAGPVGS